MYHAIVARQIRGSFMALNSGDYETALAGMANGDLYINHGVHVIRMKWGKVVSLYAYLDTGLFDEACRQMAKDGIAEASAAQIED